MLSIPAKTVYIDPEVYRRPNCRRRLERVLPHIQCTDVRELDDAARAELRRISHRRHGKDDFGDDAIVALTTFDPQRAGWFYHFRDGEKYLREHDGHCQSAVELNIVAGCVFRCAYCGFGRSLTFYLDVERFMEGLDELFDAHPRQRLYKYSNMTDLPPFEPELDAIGPMVRRFARQPGRYLMLFTKSDNVDFLADLDHRGHTIVSWSITSDRVSRMIDLRAATMDQRIDAMARVQAMGYPVRARLSPIVPVTGWREQYTELFERLFANVRPDLVTMELLGWMTVDDLEAIIEPEWIDPDALVEARSQREQLIDRHWGPFSQRTHDEVYRFCIESVRRLSPSTPVSICHGTPETWRQLGPLLSMTPRRFICNCGTASTPGGDLYARWHGPA